MRFSIIRVKTNKRVKGRTVHKLLNEWGMWNGIVSKNKDLCVT